MEQEISPGIRAQIAGWCRQIAVAHNLDPEIQQELAGHIEDKMLAYLQGREPLTEADAFVLASRQLGDPARLKEMFGRVHAGEAAVSLGRKVAAIMILQTLTGYGVKLIAGLMILTAGWFYTGSVDAFAWHFHQLYSYPVYMLVQTIFAISFIVWMLWRWKRRMAEGESPWLVRWPLWLMALIAAATLAMTPFADIVQKRFTLIEPQANQYAAWMVAMLAVVVAVIVADAVVWFWWCDSRPRRMAVMRQALMWFAAWAGLESLMHTFVRTLPERGFSGEVIMRVNGWVVAWSHPRLADALGYGLALGLFLILGGLGLAIYEAVRQRASVRETGTPQS